ncbi:MAG: 23S rRNA (pseudouridine(1915)-N(3))-methyltransferase RlmH [Gemmatimonadetes bacterium]|nr:23S rRNA (pseudouridine(1915)-N(3))-methyltransferase RlmH [Gemmatimonadota bacterium]
MKLTVISVGKPGPLLAEPIRDYENRARRYWGLEFIEVRAGSGARASDEEKARRAESERLLERVPAATELIALTRRGGDAWSSSRLSRYLAQMAVHSAAGATFLIGGAFGLSDELIRTCDRRMRLSTFTLPHDLARLVLAEQLYRAGTIMRNEPYHKAAE